ncbi:hypothetical protein SK128_018659, partial [Halocaridina rubra]
LDSNCSISFSLSDLIDFKKTPLRTRLDSECHSEYWVNEKMAKYAAIMTLIDVHIDTMYSN